MGADELEGLEPPHGFIDRAAYGETIDGRMHNNPFRADEKKSSQGNSLLFHQDTIISRSTLIQVG
jgi:hypothetical protein